jgi:hypothetical protein
MARVATIEVYGLSSLLRSLRALPKEAQNELRESSKDIASRLMVPAYKAAALRAGPWGGAIASTVRAKRDRVPSVSIGSNRRAFSGGASPTMVRYPTHAGYQGRAGASGTMPAVFGAGYGWMTHMGRYKGDALKEWLQAVDRVKRNFEAGR